MQYSLQFASASHIAGRKMNLKDAIFKTTTTALGACTLVFGISFIASLTSGFSYHLQESTEKANTRSGLPILPPLQTATKAEKEKSV